MSLVKTKATSEKFMICWECEEFLDDGCDGCRGNHFSDNETVFCRDGEHFCEDCFERLYPEEFKEMTNG